MRVSGALKEGGEGRSVIGGAQTGKTHVHANNFTANEGQGGEGKGTGAYGSGEKGGERNHRGTTKNDAGE